MLCDGATVGLRYQIKLPDTHPSHPQTVVKTTDVVEIHLHVHPLGNVVIRPRHVDCYRKRNGNEDEDTNG